ncbi:MAG TPA: DUF2834 domain-containing protein [Candidatus Limnocylindrales bacterium]|nr:DUF2834 domain-containing protein [Candidatus Limnocylindrales bacterium]
MNLKQIGLLFVLAEFAAFTGYVLYHYGVVGLFEAATANAATMQIMFDLVLALTFFTIWMIGDARQKGINPLPYLMLVLTTGSIGAMIYLIRRERVAAAATHSLAAHAARA